MLRQQNEILIKAKNQFPKYSLKTWSEKTGIQMTRIFRLFRGNEMMLSEYLAFEKILSEQGIPDHCLSLQTFHTQTKLCMQYLPLNLIEKINNSLQYHLENYFVFNGDESSLSKGGV